MESFNSMFSLSSMYNDTESFSSNGINNHKRKQSSAKTSSSASPGTPIFLRKTFDMINTCNPSIASWYDDGATFVVKDTEKFASDVIPVYFKHSNFSSFVRQLNFYGFRKIKSDPLRIKESSDESKFWKFRHEKFLQGRPDLLSEIRKNQNETADKQEVDHLKRENQDLRTKLDMVEHDISKLKAAVSALMKNQELQANATYLPHTQIATKKRHMVSGGALPIYPSTPEPSCGDALTPLPLHSEQVPSAASVATFSSYAPKSTTSADGLDDEVLASLLSLDGVDDDNFLDGIEFPDEAFSKVETEIARSNSSNVDSHLVNKVRTALATLPVDMQEMFVDRLVVAIGQPEALQRQTESMTTLIASATGEAQRRLISAGRQPNDKHLASIATIVLNAFLARSSQTAMEREQHRLALADNAAAALQAECSNSDPATASSERYYER